MYNLYWIEWWHGGWLERESRVTQTFSHQERARKTNRINNNNNNNTVLVCVCWLASIRRKNPSISNNRPEWALASLGRSSTILRPWWRALVYATAFNSFNPLLSLYLPRHSTRHPFFRVIVKYGRPYQMKIDAETDNISHPEERWISH